VKIGWRNWSPRQSNRWKHCVKTDGPA